MFDDKFVWGVASSAYQVEGPDPDDGRGKTVWDTFTEQGRIFQNQNAYTSCDHMHHYKDDYALMKNLGIKAYRFSLNWARILPEGTGRVNEKAIAMYRDMILTMKENGIPAEELTITFVCYHYPRQMLRNLQNERNINVKNIENGIYYLYGDAIPIQLIIVPELSIENNYWLNKLRNNLKSGGEIKLFMEQYEKNRDSKLCQALADTVMRANWKEVE